MPCSRGRKQEIKAQNKKEKLNKISKGRTSDQKRYWGSQNPKAGEPSKKQNHNVSRRVLGSSPKLDTR